MSIIQRIENLAYKIANPIVKALLRSPLHKIASGSLTLLHFTGHKSGRHFITPLSYVRKRDTVWLLSAHSTRWWMNLRGGDAAVALEIARTTYTGKARLWETDNTELRDRVRDYLSALPRDAKVYGIKDSLQEFRVIPEIPPGRVLQQINLAFDFSVLAMALDAMA